MEDGEKNNTFLLALPFEISFLLDSSSLARVALLCVVARRARALFQLTPTPSLNSYHIGQGVIGGTHSTRPFFGVHTMGRALTFLSKPLPPTLPFVLPPVRLTPSFFTSFGLPLRRQAVLRSAKGAAGKEVYPLYLGS